MKHFVLVKHRLNSQFWESRRVCFAEQRTSSLLFSPTYFSLPMKRANHKPRMQFLIPFLSAECLFNFLLITPCVCWRVRAALQSVISIWSLSPTAVWLGLSSARTTPAERKEEGDALVRPIFFFFTASPLLYVFSTRSPRLPPAPPSSISVLIFSPWLLRTSRANSLTSSPSFFPLHHTQLSAFPVGHFVEAHFMCVLAES